MSLAVSRYACGAEPGLVVAFLTVICLGSGCWRLRSGCFRPAKLSIATVPDIVLSVAELTPDLSDTHECMNERLLLNE